MNVYFIDSSVVWYCRSKRQWFQAPNHAYQTAAANAGWPDSERVIINRIAGYLVTPASPEQMAACRRR